MQGPQDWKTGSADPHAEHDHKAMASHSATQHDHHKPGQMSLTYVVAKARGEHMAYPVMVLPPGAQQAFGPPTGNVWTVKSDTQNRPLVRSVSYDPVSGREVSRQGFADKHPIDRIVNYGIAWHEGQLLGLFNQIVGVLTALMLVTLSVSGFIMWRRRKPEGLLGAPPPAPAKARGVAANRPAARRAATHAGGIADPALDRRTAGAVPHPARSPMAGAGCGGAHPMIGKASSGNLP